MIYCIVCMLSRAIKATLAAGAKNLGHLPHFLPFFPELFQLYLNFFRYSAPAIFCFTLKRTFLPVYIFGSSTPVTKIIRAREGHFWSNFGTFQPEPTV